ncbi:MAG: hypothetical protein M4579_003996 [Chaenotheca gracillima]|nr:MAG: hypothetical protein M4579_003996 [Chaenotheca gracillima]
MHFPKVSSKSASAETSPDTSPDPAATSTTATPKSPPAQGDKQRSSRWVPQRFMGGSSKRPRPDLVRRPSVQTRYMDMLLHMDQIPRFHNILASFFTWILLAGYVIFPGTFTTLQKSDAVHDADKSGNKVEHVFAVTIRNAPLLWVAAICCLLGGAGMLGLWFKWRENFVWLINRVFMPGFLNSLAGLISTLINVYTAQNGFFSVTAKVTVIVTGACTLFTGCLFLLYNNCVLKRLKKGHRREMDLSSSHEDEGVIEKVHRKANEPALEPGSIV